MTTAFAGISLKVKSQKSYLNLQAVSCGAHSRFAECMLREQKVGKVFEKTGSTSECETLFLEAETPSEIADASCYLTYGHFCEAFKDLKDHEWGFSMVRLFGKSGSSVYGRNPQLFYFLSLCRFFCWDIDKHGHQCSLLKITVSVVKKHIA